MNCKKCRNPSKARNIHRALKRPTKHRVELSQKRIKAVLDFLALSKEAQ